MRKFFVYIVIAFTIILSGAGYFAYRAVDPALLQQYKIQIALGIPDRIPLSGTGSMYPTFPKGTGKTYQELVEETVATISMYRYPTGFSLFDARYLEEKIAVGDIVSFENEATKRITKERSGRESGFVKRVMGVDGDRLELRNGIVYRNKEALKEPYVARAQSSFGGEFLHECREIVVPAGSIFVMGDNRKGSNDSRHELGFILGQSVTHIIPYSRQIGVYDTAWHDATNDLDITSRISIDRSAFMKLLNDKRREEKLQPLKYNDKLELSAKKRGEVMLKTNDFSFEATQSGYTMARAMDEVGYSNILWGEVPVQGYYESDELFEHLYEFTNMQKFLLDKEFQDFAITEVQGDLNGCPAQVIVMHIAGYKPPNYAKDLISSWKNALKSLQDTAPGWREAKNVEEYYKRHQTDLDRMTEIFDLRIRNLEGIVRRMETNQWLTKQQERYMDEDSKYGQEQAQLAERLNQPYAILDE